MSDQAEREIVKEDEEMEEEAVHDHVVLVTGSDGNVKVAQAEEEGKKESFLRKLHRSDSSSAGSSSDDEDGEGEKNQKKKNKDIKEKIVIDDEGKEEEVEDTEVVVEKVEAIRVEEEKKGFLEKIKEKLPSNLGNIMEKLPGYHKADQEIKEGAKKN